MCSVKVEREADTKEGGASGDVQMSEASSSGVEATAAVSEVHLTSPFTFCFLEHCESIISVCAIMFRLSMAEVTNMLLCKFHEIEVPIWFSLWMLFTPES